jgi:D-glycero-alpha-D-manno-heptose-7-phosphate kinase
LKAGVEALATHPLLITRSPLRISLGGGGTDLPSYYQEHSGFLVAAAIDRYVYITLHHRFVPKILLKYSQMEEVDNVDQIRHPLIREALRLVEGDWEGLEIASMADIPAGTGLGSSGSFTTALLKALHTSSRNLVLPGDLAEQACRLEIDILKEPVGKQDQYIAAYGGITCFRFLPNGQVEAWPLKISPQTLYNLEDHLLLFFTGYTRSAGEILRDQDAKSRKNDREMIANLHYIKQIGRDTKDALEGGDLDRFGELMNVHWEHKRQRSSQMSNERINHWYELARANGAIGGKLIGAGGGGFLMFLASDRARLKKVMQEEGLEEVRFRFDFEGTKVVIQ